MIAHILLVLLLCLMPWLEQRSTYSPSLYALAADSQLPVFHIIAHSHCDPGWLNTFEGYYLQEVKSILDSALSALLQSRARKFVWSEISYFARWWETLSLSTRASFRTVLARGQFEFVNGGWSQHDEACPDPLSMINQMTEGHRYLLHEFGVVPRVAWQIDPFGHSSVTPTLFKMMGFQALVINRIHHRVKDYFKDIKMMEFLWRGDASGTESLFLNVSSISSALPATLEIERESELFTHVLHTHYSAPQGYDWEEHAPRIDDNNLASRASNLVQMLKQRGAAYRSRHLLVPFGDDFKFKQAQLQFSQMEQLITHINAHSAQYGAEIRFSTLSDYFSAVSRDSVAASTAVSFNSLQGDFFPYADNEQSYWTGYYTTRPLLKDLSRSLGLKLRAAEILHALLRAHPSSLLTNTGELLPLDYWQNQAAYLSVARQETALFMHHDAITGTSRSNVVQDYINRMEGAAGKILDLMSNMLQHALTREGHRAPVLTARAHLLEASARLQPTSDNAPASDDRFAPHVLFNPLAWSRRELVTVRVGSRAAFVLDPHGKPVLCQIDAVFNDLASAVPAQGEFDLSFVAELPPLGAVTYFISLATLSSPASFAEAGSSPPPSGDFTLENGYVHHSITRLLSIGNTVGLSQNAVKSRYLSYEKLDSFMEDGVAIENQRIKATISVATGLLKRLSLVSTSVAAAGDADQTLNLTHTFHYYRTQQSGAYLFRPSPESSSPLFDASLPKQAVIRVTRGALLSRVSLMHHRFEVHYALARDPHNECVISASQSHSDDCINMALDMEFVPTAELNQEVTLLMEHDLNSHGLFYTHSGLAFTRRASNPSPLAGQFYPMITGLRVQDEEEVEVANTASRADGEGRRLTLFTSRTMAASASAHGRIELLIHRHLGQDDGRGLAEAVNDRTAVRTFLSLNFESVKVRGNGEKVSGLSSRPHFTDELEFNARLLRWQNRPIPFFVQPSNADSSTIDLSLDPGARQGGLVSSVSEWNRTQVAVFTPLLQSFPYAIHLHSMAARDAVSDNIAVRLQHVGATESASVSSSLHSSPEAESILLDLTDYFPPPFYIAELRRVSLSLNHRLPWSGRVASHSHSAVSGFSDFPDNSVTSNEVDADSLHPGWVFSADPRDNVVDTLRVRTFVNVGGSGRRGENQNSEEEGVFISEAALQKEREKQLALQQQQQPEGDSDQSKAGTHNSNAATQDELDAKGNSRRALLQFPELLEEKTPPPKEQSNMHRKRERKMTAGSRSVLSVPLISIAPRQLQSYLLHLALDEPITNHAQFDIDHGQPMDERTISKISHRPSYILPDHQPIKRPQNADETTRDPMQVWRDTQDVDIDSLQDKLVLPPTATFSFMRWEYLIVIFISLVAVFFFAAALGLLPTRVLRMIKGLHAPKNTAMRANASWLVRAWYNVDESLSRLWHRLRALGLSWRFSGNTVRVSSAV